MLPQSLSPLIILTILASVFSSGALFAQVDEFGAFIEENGLIVIEVESEIPDGNKFALENSDSAEFFPGYSGNGYYRKVGGNSFNQPETTVTYALKITNPGRYRFAIHSIKYDVGDDTEANDCYTRMVGHPDYQGEHTKTYQGGSAETWRWKTTHEPVINGDNKHRTPVYDLDAGVHTFELSGRSEDFCMDRMIFHLEDPNMTKDEKNNVWNAVLADGLSYPESAREAVGPGDDGPAEVAILGELKQWHKVTVELDGLQAAEAGTPNPFLDYRMDVTFTDGNLTYTVPGYFAADGDAANTSATSGSIWRAHLSPDTVGTWTYTIHFHQGPNVATEGGGTPLAPYDGLTGTFQITETDKTGRDFRGKGRLEYVGEHHLRFKGTGEYFLKVGPDSPENLLAYDDIDNTPDNKGFRKSWAAHAGDWNDGDPTWKGNKGKGLIGAINYLASEEMSTLPFLTMNTPDGDDRNVFPWINTSDYSRLDVSKLAQWGIVFDHATANGLYLHFKMQEQEIDLELDGGALGNQRKLYLRELIARFGYHPALNWNIGEENNVDWAGDGAPTVEQRKDMIQYIHDTDPYNHLIVVHPAGDPDDLDALFRPLLGDESELTGLSVQLDKDTKNHLGTAVFDETLKWVNESAAVGKKWVVAIDEAGGALIGVSPDFEDPNNQNDARKNTLWGNIMAGGAGMETYFGFRSNYGDLTDEDYRTRDAWWDYCRYAVRFFTDNGVPFHEMSNSDLSSNSNSWTLDKDGVAYVVYLRQGGTTNLDLSGQTGTFSVAWYDPRNGGALQTGSVTSVDGGSSVSLGSAPSNTNEDWVILVRNADLPEDPYTLQALTDFPDIEAGPIPYYVHSKENALAIDAEIEAYRGPFARATSTFYGVSGYYDITLTALQELDGECDYRVYINGSLVGEATNAQIFGTGIKDYTPLDHLFENIYVPANASIWVESNAVTNGLIPENGGTAYARGRWTTLSLAPSSITPTGPSVESFTLIDATTDQPVAGFDPIPDGAVISTLDIGTSNLNIRANTSPNSDFGSVVFELSGATSTTQIESGFPWALFGGSNGDFYDNSFANGSYTLTATPYDQNGGAGNAGNALTLSFTITDQSMATDNLYSHSFNGSSGSLNGTAVDDVSAGHGTGGTWIADNGAEQSGAFAKHATASLPFAPEDGYVYTLTITGTYDGSGWLGFGYSKTHDTAELSRDNDGLIWALARPGAGQDEAHFDPSGGADAIGSATSTPNPTAASIVLDTTDGSGSWDVQWFVNGSLLAEQTDIDPAFETAITAVKLTSGFGANTYHSLELTVSTSSAQAQSFGDWMADYPSLTGDDALPEAHPNNSLLSNLENFAFGGDPTDPSDDSAIVPKMAIVEDSGTGEPSMKYTFNCRVASDSIGLFYYPEYIDDLSLTTWLDDEVTITDVTPIDDAFDAVTVTVPFNPIGNKRFIRMRIGLE